MRALRNSVLAIALAMTSGCCATVDLINADYAAADQGTYDAVAPKYLEYVASDDGLTAEEKTRRARTVDTWRLRLEQAKAPVLPAEGEGE